MSTVRQWAVYCRMTCVGGSERGKCPCKRPTDCELQDHPDYPRKRGEATARMLRHLNNDLEAIGSLLRIPTDDSTT